MYAMPPLQMWYVTVLALVFALIRVALDGLEKLMH